MIFYFSGTGNSAYAARKLLREGERLISMADAVRDGVFEYLPGRNEDVGFVFPVYFYGLPDTVRTFVRQLHLLAKPAYTYAVITCGGSIGGAGNLLRQFLGINDIPLRAVYTVKMPDNYVLMYDVPTEEAEKKTLAKAEKVLEDISGDIKLRRFHNVDVNSLKLMKTSAVYPFYDKTRKTDKFYADDSCVGCGKCAANCPANAIEMREGKPVWVKPNCDHCLRCLGCEAVQYGKRTVGKRRYIHPSEK